MKITVIGAGNVGSSCAHVLAARRLCSEIILIDTKEGYAEGKAKDIAQSLAMFGISPKIIGTDGDYTPSKNSEIVIITAGVRRTEDITREELLKSNIQIITEVTSKIIDTSPNAIFIIVSNPLDILTRRVCDITDIPNSRIIGMAGPLDIARYKRNLAEALQISSNNIEGQIIGPHSDDMLILPQYSTVSGIPITSLLSENDINKVIEKTKSGGKEIIQLIGQSAWLAPGAGAARIVEAIRNDEKVVMNVSSMMKNKYGLDNCCMGAPTIIGKNGIEKVIELELTQVQKDHLMDSINKQDELYNSI